MYINNRSTYMYVEHFLNKREANKIGTEICNADATNSRKMSSRKLSKLLITNHTTPLMLTNTHTHTHQPIFSKKLNCNPHER